MNILFLFINMLNYFRVYNFILQIQLLMHLYGKKKVLKSHGTVPYRFIYHCKPAEAYLEVGLVSSQMQLKICKSGISIF